MMRFVFAMLAGLSTAQAASSTRPEKQQLTNVLFIISDDLTATALGGHDGWQQGSWKRSFPPEVVEELDKEPSK